MTGLYLEKMTQEDYEAYHLKAVPNYADELIKGGVNNEDAWKIAESSFQTLLPDGVKTKDHFLYIIKNHKTSIGILWLSKKSNESKEFAYINDIDIKPEFRDRGFGKESMLLAEKEALKLDLNSISLHVFGHNDRAIGLYQKVGYRTTNIVMTKDLKK